MKRLLFFCLMVVMATNCLAAEMSSSQREGLVTICGPIFVKKAHDSLRSRMILLRPENSLAMDSINFKVKLTPAEGAILNLDLFAELKACNTVCATGELEKNSLKPEMKVRKLNLVGL